MKGKGSRTERELLHKFFARGWMALRCAGSGSTQELAVDLIAGKDGRVLAIECKASKKETKRYLKEEQIEGLKEFSKTFGAEAWIGMKYNNEGWLFLKPEDLDKSKKGTFCVDLKLAKEKGKKIWDLIE